MNEHLLLVTLGPVQEFIAQARRTRDLWYGSHLLSELGRAAARALVGGGAKLVFPALDEGDLELESCSAPVRPSGQPPLSIPNKLLAAVPSGVDPAQLARVVRQQVLRHWRNDIAAPVKDDCKGLLAPHIEDVWAEQIDTLVEFLASWAPPHGYSEARRAVESAIAGRKNLRDFSPWQHTRGAVPKSSLDGARETVLRPPKERDSRLVKKYRIAEGEQLDAVALVKRAGGEPDQFVPVVNIAFACWVELANSAAAPEIENLREACRAAGVSRVARNDLPWSALFPFDASILLPNRWDAIFEEQGMEGDPQSWGRTHVGPLLRKISDPYPYIACLVADGDHMGRALDRLATQDGHRAFSKALSNFAVVARKIVERDHSGALIYSGGDDVLAFLPLPKALACAEDLRLAFEKEITSACGSVPADVHPTLSGQSALGSGTLWRAWAICWPSDETPSGRPSGSATPSQCWWICVQVAGAPGARNGTRIQPVPFSEAWSISMACFPRARCTRSRASSVACPPIHRTQAGRESWRARSNEHCPALGREQ